MKTKVEQAAPALAEAIRLVRFDAKMTQAEFAERVGIWQNSLSRLECGKHEPDTMTLLKIGEVAKPGPARDAIISELRMRFSRYPLVRVLMVSPEELQAEEVGMSRLTDCQIEALISRCESAAEMYTMEGRREKAQRSAATAAKYRDELAARRCGEAVQTPQRRLYGERSGRGDGKA